MSGLEGYLWLRFSGTFINFIDLELDIFLTGFSKLFEVDNKLFWF